VAARRLSERTNVRGNVLDRHVADMNMQFDVTPQPTRGSHTVRDGRAKVDALSNSAYNATEK